MATNIKSLLFLFEKSIISSSLAIIIDPTLATCPIDTFAGLPSTHSYLRPEYIPCITLRSSPLSPSSLQAPSPPQQRKLSLMRSPPNPTSPNHHHQLDQISPTPAAMAARLTAATPTTMGSTPNAPSWVSASL